jgi:membrane protease YdiL (CAAX protease family)
MQKLNSNSRFLKRHSLTAGLALMFLFTWPIDLPNSGVLPYKVPFAIYVFLGWGFIFASLIMTGLTLGRGAVITLLKRYRIWRVRWQWYLVAFLLFPATFFSAVLLNAALTRSPIDFNSAMAYEIFGTSARLPLLILPFFLFDAISNGEEMGWRGYVLPRLQVKYNALISSLILGLIWGFWHLPKYLMPESTASFWLGMVKILAEAVLYTWLYNNTNGSLLLATIFHAAGNTSGVFLPMANTVSGENMGVQIIATALEVLAAVMVVIMTTTDSLSVNLPAQKQYLDVGV